MCIYPAAQRLSKFHNFRRRLNDAGVVAAHIPYHARCWEYMEFNAIRNCGSKLLPYLHKQHPSGAKRPCSHTKEGNSSMYSTFVFHVAPKPARTIDTTSYSATPFPIKKEE